jgi:hypothetical protein
VEGEDLAEPRLWIAEVHEARDRASGEVYEGKLFVVQITEPSVGITFSLSLVGGKALGFLLALRLHDADRFLVDEENIVSGTNLSGIFADCHAKAGL